MSVPTPAPASTPARKSLNARTILLFVLAVILGVFAFKNLEPVTVWPLGADKPLILVIGIAFVLGALIGFLLKSILGHHRAE
jgi:uncharacterized integral membrane protein